MVKVNEQIKREIGQILLKEMGDPRFMFVTITDVETSKDLRHAKVFYSILGDKKNFDGIKASLERATGKIRKLVGDQLTMRYTPELIFYFDETIEKSARIDQTLQEIKGDDDE
jgi:ribosome-binding factor A